MGPIEVCGAPSPFSFALPIYIRSVVFRRFGYCDVIILYERRVVWRSTVGIIVTNPKGQILGLWVFVVDVTSVGGGRWAVFARMLLGW